MTPIAFFEERALVSLLCLLADYHLKMQVCEAMELPDGKYYLCPRCGVALDRDFQIYCSCCGQHLDWSGHEKAAVIFPPAKK